MAIKFLTGINSNGAIDASGGITGLDLSNGISGSNFNITGVNEIRINDPGEGIVWTSGSSGNMSLAITDDSSDNILNLSGTGAKLAVNNALVATQDWVNNNFTVEIPAEYLTESEGDARYLGTTAKAADSNLLDGINSSQFVRSDQNSVTIGRHLDANTTWTNGALTLFLGWYSGKTILGNNNDGGHDYASALGGNTIPVLNRSYFYKTAKFEEDIQTDGKLNVLARVGTWITSNVMSDSIGWNTNHGVYIGSNVGGTHYLRGNGKFTTGGSTYDLWHEGNFDPSTKEAAGAADAVNARIDDEVFPALNDLGNAIPTNNNQLTNGAGYITSADGGNAATLDSIDSTGFIRDFGTTAQANINTISVNSGKYRWNSSTVGRPASSQANEYGTLLHLNYDGTYASQLAYDIAQSNLYIRHLATTSDTGSTWKRLLTDSDLTPLATTSYVDTAVSNLVDSAPAALNTLNELAAALGDDVNFSTTVTNNIAAVNERIDTEVFDAIATVDGNIPTNNNQLTNGAGYITSSSLPSGSQLVKVYNNVDYVPSGDANQRGNYGAGVTVYEGYSGGANRPFTYDTTAQFMSTTSQGFEISIDWVSNSTTPMKVRSLRDCCQGWNPWTTIWTEHNFTGTDISNWNTAYGWGNHASAGYLTIGQEVPSQSNWQDATMFYSEGDIAFSGAGNHSLQVVADNGNDAFMAFHIHGDHAVYFGLENGTNRLYTGGWSLNSAKYQIWDSRDFDPSDFASTESVAAVNDRIDSEVLPQVTDNATGIDNNRNEITALGTAVAGKLDATAKAADSNLLDGINSTSFVRSDANDTVSGKITFTYQDTADPLATIELRGNGNHSGLYINPHANKQAHVRFASNGALKWQMRVPFQDGVNSPLKIYSWVDGADRYTFNHNGYLNAVGFTASGGITASGDITTSSEINLPSSHNKSKIQLHGNNGQGHCIGTESYHNTYGADTWNSGTIGHKFYGAANSLIATLGEGGAAAGGNTSTFYGNVRPAEDRVMTLGEEALRWQIVFCEILDSAGQHEKNLQNPEGEKSVGEYETGTVLVWKGGKNVPCTEYADHMRMGIAVKGIDSPLIQGAEPVLVTGLVNEGDYIVTSRKEGHAEAMSPEVMRQQNLFDCVIGKALESGDGESYLIKTWINI